MKKIAVVWKVAGRQVQRIALSEIFADPLVQRGIKKKHIAKILGAKMKNGDYKDFVEEAVRNIVVSRRERRLIPYSVLDGNHRVEMCRILGFTHIWAEIHEGLTIAQEAKLFKLLNGVSLVSVAYKFKNALTSGDDMETMVNTIVNQAGCKLKIEPTDKHHNLIKNIGVLMNAANSDGYNHLRIVMRVLVASFPNEIGILQDGAKNGRFLAGFCGAVLAGTKKDLSIDHMIDRLLGYDAGELLSYGRFIAKGNGFKEIATVTDILTDIIFGKKPKRHVMPTPTPMSKPRRRSIRIAA